MTSRTFFRELEQAPRHVVVKVPKTVPKVMRYTIPVGFSPRVAYYVQEDVTRITYDGQTVTLPGRRVPMTSYDAWNHWRFGGLE